MSDPESLFASCDVAVIRSMIATRQEEHLHLDFKLLARDDFSDRNDRKSLAAALSGFANSDGGVIIWGVDARPNAQSVDCATGESPLADTKRALARLNALTGECVSPLVDGVRHRAIPLEGSTGFVVTLVPSSASGPHMAKGGEDRYFKRSGSAFYRMEHFDLEDMFGRRQKPLLGITSRFQESGTTTSAGLTEYRALLIVGLANHGRGLTRFPYLTLTIEAPHKIDAYGIDGNGNEGLPRLRSMGSNVTTYGGNADTVIHPGTARDIAGITVATRVDGKLKIAEPAPLRFHADIAAEGISLRREEFTFSAATIMAATLPARLYTPSTPLEISSLKRNN